MVEEAEDMSRSQDNSSDSNDSKEDYGSSDDAIVKAGKRFVDDAASGSGEDYDDEESLEELDDQEGLESSVESVISLDEESKVSNMNEVVSKELLEQDSPELQELLTEFKETLEAASEKIQPLLVKAKQGLIPSTAAGISYLEMKYNLMISYCSFLTFFLLLKIEGKDVKSHPVIDRLIYIKTLFEKLKPLDQKLQYQIDKMTQAATGQATALKYKPKLEEMQMPVQGAEVEESDKNASDSGISDNDSSSDVKKRSTVKKDGVYKAPLKNPVAYDDKTVKKS